MQTSYPGHLFFLFMFHVFWRNQSSCDSKRKRGPACWCNNAKSHEGVLIPCTLTSFKAFKYRQTGATNTAWFSWQRAIAWAWQSWIYRGYLSLFVSINAAEGSVKITAWACALVADTVCYETITSTIYCKWPIIEASGQLGHETEAAWAEIPRSLQPSTSNWKVN